MATARDLAQTSLASAKKRVRLDPMSVGDATAVVFTVLRSSAAPLLTAARKSKEGKKLPFRVKLRPFYNAVNSVVDHRKGSIYAAAVTSVDTDNIFHTERFALALKRLGVMDDLGMKITTAGYGVVSKLIEEKAPWFWAELVAKELDFVRKQLSNTVHSVLRKFTEEVDTEDLDQLIEAHVMQLPVSSMSGKLQLLHGASKLELGGGYRSVFQNLYRTLANVKDVTLLNPTSSLDATFESFHQHLMTNTSALQKLLQGSKFGGKKLDANQLQRLFRDPMLVRGMKRAFDYAYDRKRHAVSIDGLYRGMKRFDVAGAVQKSAKGRINKQLSADSVSGIVSSVVGLFFAFAGDTKGQAFPAMKALMKRG